MITFYIFIGILGIIVGSFLNVCIYRLPKGENILYTFSKCPFCKNRLRSYDLIPVFSYLFLKGCCRYCESSISPRYLVVELITGTVFLLTFLVVGWNELLIKYLFVFSLLIVVSFIDIEHQIIPNKLMFILIIWLFGWQIFVPEISFYQALIGAFLGGGLFFFAAIFSGGGMGGGDIKLMFSAGFLLGVSPTILAIFISSLVGGIIGLVFIALKLKDRKDLIPFGPFLSFAIFISSLWGEEIINIYLDFFV